MGLEGMARALDAYPCVRVSHNPVLKTQPNEMAAEIAC
jgi:hypothetical protein